MAQVTVESRPQPTLAQSYQPYIKASENVSEFTLRALILGSILALVFGVANAYLGLKVGMTVSASIPAAVMSMAILRGVLKRGTVLENNIVQTIGSSGESLAAGVIFTIPAFLIWQASEPEFTFKIANWQIVVLSILGGFLGILFMIPLRRHLIVKEHGILPYPEGTACAEILVAGDEGGSKARTVFAGLGIGGLYKALMSGGKLWPDNFHFTPGFFKGSQMGVDATPALMGVGFIIGPRIAALMFAGAVLGYVGIGPLLAFLGNYLTTPVPPATVPMAQLSPAELRLYYIRYIGIGAVAMGGFISLLRSFPSIISSFKQGIGDFAARGATATVRTDQDLSLKLVLGGSFLVAVAIWLLPGTQMHFVGALLAVLFGFFFVTVSSRMVGIVGSSSLPVSGMTIGTLIVASVILLAYGVSGTAGMVGAMMVGTVVAIAVSMSGDASQDLKTGFLVGATPKKQQIAEFVGVLVPAVIMGYVLLFLNKTHGFVGPGAFEAPQANAMSAVVKGVMTGNLPWIFVIVGTMVGLSIELLGVHALPVAIGLYLSPDLSTPIVIGSLIYLAVQTFSNGGLKNSRIEKGILFGSGLVAGDALVGVGIAFLVGSISSYEAFFRREDNIGTWLGGYGQIFTLGIFLLLGLGYLYHIWRMKARA